MRSRSMALLTLLFISVQYGESPALAAKKFDFSGYSDEALVRRLSEIGGQINARVNTGQLLMALRPDPAYVVTSSTSFFGHLSGTASIYRMPRGYTASFAGTLLASGTTTYSYYDVNSFSRSLNSLGILINQISIQRKQREFQALLAEIQNRVRIRRQRVEAKVRNFFTSNPELRGKEDVFSAALPWVLSKKPDLSVREALNAARDVVLEVERRGDLSGRWYGVFSQESILDSGQKANLSSFVIVDLVQGDDGKVQGQGTLGTGDLVVVAGEVSEGAFTGRLENITSGYHTVLSAAIGGDRLEADFEGTAAGQTYTGRAVLVR